MRTPALTTLLLSAAAAPAWAHPGHGDPGLAATPLHYLTEPAHLPLVLGGLAAAVAATVVLARRSRRREG